MAKKSFADRFYAPKNILINVAQLLIVLPIAFFAITAVAGGEDSVRGDVVGLSSIMVGVILGTWVVLFGPPNLFSGGLLGGREKPIAELEEPARRILTFFKSRSARTIIYRVAGCLAIFLLIIWSVVKTYFPSPFPPDPSVWSVVVVVVFSITLPTACTEFGILALYILLHWDKIQKEYEPWPIDKPYIDLSTYTHPQSPKLIFPFTLINWVTERIRKAFKK